MFCEASPGLSKLFIPKGKWWIVALHVGAPQLAFKIRSFAKPEFISQNDVQTYKNIRYVVSGHLQSVYFDNFLLNTGKINFMDFKGLFTGSRDMIHV